MNLKTAKRLKDCLWDVYRKGLTTSSGGNISMKDEHGNIWISPSQIDKGFLAVDDFACINIKGELLNENKPSMEFPFHQSIYDCKPEVKAVCHLHAPVLVALSLLKPDQYLFNILEKFNCSFAAYAIPGSEELGRNICKALGKKPEVVIMQNHGVIAVANSISEAASKIERLSQKIQGYFGIEDEFVYAVSEALFETEANDSIAFYTKRAGHFLNLPSELKIAKINEMYQAEFALKSLKSLCDQGIRFTNKIIPESYLLLQKDVHIDESANIRISAKSLYGLYDKIEVLDFSARVLLLGNSMGVLNLLTDSQIKELNEKF